MSTPVGNQTLTRILLGVGGLLACIVVGAGASHSSGMATQVPISTVIAQRDLSFQDLMDGGIIVKDAKNGHVIANLIGQNGFLRATVRGLAQQRRRENNDENTPFRLTAWADNRLTLDDPVTGRHVELEAFGATNESVFAELLVAKEAVE
jgi:putative photosynthetic complex assembly protein